MKKCMHKHALQKMRRSKRNKHQPWLQRKKTSLRWLPRNMVKLKLSPAAFNSRHFVKLSNWTWHQERARERDRGNHIGNEGFVCVFWREREWSREISCIISNVFHFLNKYFIASYCRCCFHFCCCCCYCCVSCRCVFPDALAPWAIVQWSMFFLSLKRLIKKKISGSHCFMWGEGGGRVDVFPRSLYTILYRFQEFWVLVGGWKNCWNICWNSGYVIDCSYMI